MKTIMHPIIFFSCTFFLITAHATLPLETAVLSKRQTSCPSVWTSIALDLQSSFTSDGSCTDTARQAIRASFHDCFPGSCDGSLILANECTTRGENTQITSICSTLSDKATNFNVSTADMIQFAAAIGIASCSGGPITSFYAGRQDSTTASATGQIPSGAANASTLVALFAAKGFSTTDLVALTGAHTIGKQLDGTAMDTTVSQWDAGFYTEVADNTATDPLASDRFLSNSSDTSAEWSTVGGSTASFETAFVSAMEKMSLLGNVKGDLTDCSDVVSGYAAGTLSQKSVAAVAQGEDGVDEEEGGVDTTATANSGTSGAQRGMSVVDGVAVALAMTSLSFLLSLM